MSYIYNLEKKERKCCKIKKKTHVICLAILMNVIKEFLDAQPYLEFCDSKTELNSTTSFMCTKHITLAHVNWILHELKYLNLVVELSATIVQTGEMFPAKFQDRGPDQPLRSARHFTGAEEVTGFELLVV